MATDESVHQSDDNRNPVFVSEVLGDGVEAHRIVRVGEWSLIARAVEGDEPRIRDLDLGARVYPSAKPHKIRERIRDLMAEGAPEFRPLEVFPQPGKTGGRPGAEFWLNEHEAIFLVSQIDTAEARTFTHAMIRVFRLAVRGLLPQQRHAIDPAALSALVTEAVRAQVGAVVAELRAVERPELAVLDRDAEIYILAPIRAMARTLAGINASEREVSRQRSAIHARVRRVVGWQGMWRLYPRHRLGELLVARQAEQVLSDRVAEALAHSRQLSLKAV